MHIASFQAKHAAEIECRLKHGGGLMPVIGWARFAAAVLFLFIIRTTLAFQRLLERRSRAAQDQMIQFSKNLAMMRGMLYIVVHTPGPLSLDRK